MKHAVLVGIDDYPDSPLSCAVSDAREMAALLTMQEYGFHCDVLLNAAATRAALRKTIAEAKASNPAPDILLFFFAGHGCVSENGALIMTADAQPYDEGIHLDELARAIMGELPPETKAVAILDCCHSGFMPLRGRSYTDLRALTNDDMKRAFILSTGGRVLLAACEASKTAKEDVTEFHGVFTQALLDGLTGGASSSNGEITVTSLHDYIVRSFREKGISQVPVFKGDILGSFVLGSGISCSEIPSIRIDNYSRSLEQLDEEVRSMNALIVDRSQDYAFYSTEGYRECASKLTAVKDHSEHLQISSLNPSQKALFSTLTKQIASMLRRLGEPDRGFHTRVGILQEQLGAGSFGTVWKVQDEAGRVYAYKVYHSHDLGDADKLARFCRGYRAMERLDHAHIVRVRYLTECPYGIVMDYIDGQNLRSLSQGLDTPSEKIRILITVAETLQHAHVRGVTHRDLKPENIVLEYSQDQARWKPYLTDFDLAWYASATMLTDQALGTVHYAAPEQLRTPGSSAAKRPTVDIYSFGMLMYYLFAAHDPQPFAFEQNVAGMRSALNRSSALLSASAAEDLLRLFEQCSRESYQARPTSMREIIDDLHRILEDIHAIRPTQVFAWEQFCQELSFKAVGLVSNNAPAAHRFRTASGRTDISLELHTNAEGSNVKIRVYCLELPAMEGQDTKSAVQKLSKRIDEVIGASGCNDTKRTAGNTGPYETFLTVPVARLDFENIERLRKFIALIVDALERI